MVTQTQSEARTKELALSVTAEATWPPHARTGRGGEGMKEQRGDGKVNPFRAATDVARTPPPPVIFFVQGKALHNYEDISLSFIAE